MPPPPPASCAAKPAADVPTGNAYDKYGSANAVERRLVAGFFAALDRGLPATPPRRILEVGLGEGEVATRVQRRFPGVPLTGIDLLDDELGAAWRAGGLHGAFADIAWTPFPNSSFDLVLAIEVLEHVPDPEAALRELARIGTGTFVLSVPREPLWRAANMARGKYLRDLGNTPGHIQHWSARQFVAFVGRHLEVVSQASPFPWTLVVARR